MSGLCNIMKSVFDDSNMLNSLKTMESNKDVYDFFVKQGYKGSFEEFGNEIKTFSDMVMIPDEDLSNISGGVMGQKTCRFLSTVLSVFTLSTSLGNFNVYAKEDPIKNSSISVSSGKNSSTGDQDIEIFKNVDNLISKVNEEIKEEKNELVNGKALKKKDVSEETKKILKISSEMSEDSYEAAIEDKNATPDEQKEAKNSMDKIRNKNYKLFGDYNGVPGGVMKVHELNGKKCLFIAFHGTNDKNDIVADSIFKMQKCDFLDRKDIHVGFFDRFNILCRLKNEYSKVGNCQEEMNKIVKSQNIDKVVLTGHSLGGALATLMALFLSTKNEFKGKVSLVTFCSPRVLSKEAYEVAKKILPEENVIRVWRKGDVISSVPYARQGFKHFGISWCLNKNHLKTYTNKAFYILSWFNFSDWYEYFNFCKYHSIVLMREDINNIDSLIDQGKILKINT